nr:hypothetical protein [Acinetobacter baumannii]
MIMKAVWFLIILSLCLNVKCTEDQIPSKYSGNLIKTAKLAFKQNNICPDYIHQCSGSDPCCRTPTGIFTCCPYPYGSCCVDGLHCCPYGMVCYGNTTCMKANKKFTIFKLKTLTAPKLNDIVKMEPIV